MKTKRFALICIAAAMLLLPLAASALYPGDRALSMKDV